MPRFFDDYSNTYLTHDSAAGRKQQRRGWKFRENFKLYYKKHLEAWQSGPMGLAAAQQAFLRANADNPSAPSPPLPEGWIEEEDEVTRATYYMHKQSGERTWVRPGFVPPPAIGRGVPPMMVANNRFSPSSRAIGGGGAPAGFGTGGPPPPPPLAQGSTSGGFRPPHLFCQPGGPVSQPMRGFPPPPQGGPPPPFPPPPMGFSLPPPHQQHPPPS